MNNIKAILGGFLTIIILGLLAQLIFLFVGVGYFKLVKIYPAISFISEITIIILFIITAIVAFIGGAVTAKLSRAQFIINCLIVGALAGALTLVPSLISGYDVTVNAVIFVLVFLISTVAGGAYFIKRTNRK